MAKRGLSGQLNLFDFWGDTNPEDSIVEMVSLIPEETIEPEEAKEPEEESKEGAPERSEEVPEITKTQAPVMHKEKKDKNGNVLSEISYLNYNKVFLRNSKYQQGKLFEFENSKEAVDFYIIEMMKLTGEDSWDQE